MQFKSELLSRELHYFFNAWVFFTRFPAPKWVQFNDEHLQQGARYFSLIGLCLGLLCAGCFYLFSLVFTVDLAVLLTLVIGIFATGAFHEDGWADCCDGFGGGYAKTQILTIMKDSRLGTYGVVGLIGLLATKYLALLNIAQFDMGLGWVLVCGFAASRFMATVVIYSLDYVQFDGTSKSKPLATDIRLEHLMFSAALGLVPLWMLSSIAFWGINGLLAVSLWSGLAAAGVSTFLLARYFKARIGGFTGDCLGAVQQVSEVSFYLLVLLVWSLFGNGG